LILILIISDLIIYFSIGLIYLLLHFIFSGFKHSAKRYLILFLSFVIVWPILLFNSIRLCFTIGKYLTFEGRWQLFFPARETKKEESDNNFVSSEMSDFFDEADNDEAPF
jgi:energy-coupling factor transporter transmembrane protein EcfT